MTIILSYANFLVSIFSHVFFTVGEFGGKSIKTLLIWKGVKKKSNLLHFPLILNR